MIILGSKKSLFAGSLVLAALLLVGYNGFNLISLFNPSLVGRSVEVKLASQKWQQLKERSALATKNALDFDLALILSKVLPGFQEMEKTASKTPVGEGEGKNAIETKLPPLAGIMGVTDVHGREQLLAVIEGAAHPEKARVQDYTIKEITQKGIVLTKNGKDWFVPAPEVYFSLDRRGLSGQ